MVASYVKTQQYRYRLAAFSIVPKGQLNFFTIHYGLLLPKIPNVQTSEE